MRRHELNIGTYVCARVSTSSSHVHREIYVRAYKVDTCYKVYNRDKTAIFGNICFFYLTL